MYKTITFFLIASLSFQRTSAQQTDTLKKLQEVVIKAYLTQQPLLTVPAAVGTINLPQLQMQSGFSLVPAVNTVPGVRMEERSPGSYRLSIRGSLLRSPFGVRNVKIYMDEFPLTDAGGNTYLNLLDLSAIQNITVLRGPDGSLYGANSNGVVLIDPFGSHQQESTASVGFDAGSYNSYRENIAVKEASKNNQLNISQSWQQSNGYRQNSALKRKFIQAADTWTYAANGQLKALFFYTDIDYQTPGGLTLPEFLQNPQAARPATATSPGAIEQHAAVYNKTVFGGVANESFYLPNLKHVIAVYGMHTNFDNPFITNEEVRLENTIGLRSYLELSSKQHNQLDWKWDLGTEMQQTKSDINNYDNNKGVRGSLQASSHILSKQSFYFTRFAATIIKKIHAETALSLNNYSYNFTDVAASAGNNHFKPVLMPRVALSYQVTNNFAWRATVSRGYSTPATAEVRPTSNIINNNLQAEKGWNYETGFRKQSTNARFNIDAAVFYYRLNNAIVRRLNDNGTEYYLNAGGTNQAGIETSVIFQIIPANANDFVRSLTISNSLTLSRFRFRDYFNASANYSGNKLTGVPATVSVSQLNATFPARFYFFLQHNYTAKLPLDDANTAFANAYHLIQTKVGWNKNLSKKTNLNIYAGIDNLLNQHYSLGNDLNAVGLRYYNAAPLRNWFAGIQVQF
ncbi:TonB-dependent receptor [Mucilaginibacter arboris]|uniref:TonB-dependent receptor plug domain-containing protein n=1 Tax=Mucilaginibacter arboris TaxID=2682090 RepID=A0A7K1SWL9_9SPHI|nr:TonB-dependent receptor [Mucilaginibacter arboris]MVN21722.1 TonB-dependent receptor plug domain-containing protein [Mucilaginibacter arboris]